MSFKVPIARSDVHIHLCREDADLLFGTDYQFTNIRELTIPGNYACSETVSLIGPEGKIEGVVVVGPKREYTQVEVSRTNCLTLGIDAPVRSSGDIENSAGITVRGPAGSIVMKKGVIIAARHIHMHTDDALKLGLTDGQTVRVRVDGDRSLVFENVVLKIGEDQALEMHVDFDEGHAAGITDFQLVELLLN